MNDALQAFTEHHMKDGRRFVPARLQSALALLERLRDAPSLALNDHLVPRGKSGLVSHETFGKRAHERFGLEPVNSTHGRRSSNLQDWGQELLDILQASGFERLPEIERCRMIDSAQLTFANALRAIIDEQPLEVHTRGRSAEAVVRDVLRQAVDKGKAGDVAQYLVGAKLVLRLNVDIPANPANKADRQPRSEHSASPGDFVVANAVIEVAVGLPDEKHLSQIAEALQDTEIEFWLLTSEDRVVTWRNELAKLDGVDVRRVIVASVEGFVGQNISELAGFSNRDRTDKLRQLFEIYNRRWIDELGPPGLRVVAK